MNQANVSAEETRIGCEIKSSAHAIGQWRRFASDVCNIWQLYDELNFLVYSILDSRRMISSVWKNIKPSPPMWVVDAFSLLGPEYEHIAKILARRMDAFRVEVIPEIEAAFEGSQDILNVNEVMTADQQRTMFFKAAIEHADYYRPIAANERKDGTKRPNVNGDVSKLKDLQKKIAKNSQELARDLRSYQVISQRLGVRHFDLDPIWLLNQIYSQKSAEDSVTNFTLAHALQQCLQFGPFLSGADRFAGILEALKRNLGKPLNSFIPVEGQIGIEGNHPSSWSNFALAFDIWLHDKSEDAGGFVPVGFKLTNRCWAALATCLLDIDANDNSLPNFRKRAADRSAKWSSGTESRFLRR